MCGLAGFLARPGAWPEADAIVRRMTDAIAHRGPDSDGHWLDPEAGIAFGHRRLAIVDLSPAGHQPMVSPSGRYHLIYNGEIYNHLDLRAELADAGAAPNWNGHSDTETLLACVDLWGLERTLEKLIGMFAIALWDRENRDLSLARDRMGEKPLYFGWQGQGPTAAFLFGSELKALAQHPAFARNIARDSIVEVLRHGNVGENRSIWQGISKVLPGEIVSLSLAQPEPNARRYWNGAAVAASRTPAGLSDAEAVAQLETLLLDAVGRQMMSDVSLGAFLSGGIDSSTVVALMQHLSERPVHTFSIGFHEQRYNEAEFAKAIAVHLGTDHTELYVSDKDLRDVVPRLPVLYDEPFADSSQLPTYLVAELTRRDVTVALSGDGGDELFCGYGRYQHAAKLRAKLNRVPLALRQLGAGGLRAVPASALTRVLEPIVPTPQGKEPIGQRLHRLANYARQPDLEALHRTMVSVWRFPDAAVLGGQHPPSLLAENLPARGDLSEIERMMQLDMVTYMVDDILAKVDRATMAVSLESRAPFLDHRIVEFAWSLPEEMKLRGDESKWVLRQVLDRYVPRALFERPKMGFEVPIGLWLRGGLKAWAADLLDPVRLRREGIFDAALIDRLWREHQSERFNWGAQLWCVLMVQAWMADYVSAE